MSNNATKSLKLKMLFGWEVKSLPKQVQMLSTKALKTALTLDDWELTQTYLEIVVSQRTRQAEHTFESKAVMDGRFSILGMTKMLSLFMTQFGIP